MANSWLRLYHDMPNDPKWRTIAKVAGQTIPVVLAVYVHLLTIASGAVERGTLCNVNSEDLASALDVECAAVDAVLIAMRGRVLDGEKLSGWDKRQVNREDSSTERVKRYRQRKVTPMKRTVTQEKPDVTADKKREEESTEEKQKPSRVKAASDPRHEPFRKDCEAYAKFKGVTFVWDGGEAKQLATLLAAAPDLTGEAFRLCLTHRARSDVPHGERPRKWLGDILRFQEGPLDAFGKPKGIGNGKFAGKTESSLNAAHEAIRIISQRAEDARNCADASEVGYPAPGEAGHGGLLGAG